MSHIMRKLKNLFRVLVHGSDVTPDLDRALAEAKARNDRAHADLSHTMDQLTSVPRNDK